MNSDRAEYVNLFNLIKNEWRMVNACMFANAFISEQLCDYIIKRKIQIARLGELHRRLGLDER